MDDEYDGGTIMRECPHCGQYCKEPEHYHVEFKDSKSWNGTCYADSYCKRCKKKVKLSVVFW